jgi:dihydrofolate reductase
MSSALTDRPSGMGELVITTFMTLDGVMQAPGGRDEDREGGFEHGGWQEPVSDPASGERMYEEFQTWDAYLLGRRTYDIFASFWPNQPDDSFTRLVNDLPRYVASRTLRTADWAGTTILDGDVAQQVADIKGRHRRIGLWGSADLVQTLLRHDLVDRLDLWIYPLLLGTGKRIFAEGTVPAAFRRTEVTPFEGGAIHAVYEHAGRPTYAEMGDGS